MSDLEWLKKFADEATHVQRLPFLITTSLFLAISTVSFILRIFFRFRHDRTWFLNDYLLIFSFICFIAGTTVMHTGLWDTYFALAASSDPVLAAEVPSEQLTGILARSVAYSEALHCLLWTAIFGSKFSLLSFFQQFINRTGRAARMYWIAICMITGFCWVYMMGFLFIACPYSGEKMEQCKGRNNERLLRVLSYIGAVADCVPTTLILSLSFIILHRVRLVLHQVLVAGTFTFLCAAIITISIVRVAVIKNPERTTRDLPLQTFLLYLEACVVLIAVSMIAFHSLYNQHYENADQENRLKWNPRTLVAKPRHSTESVEHLNLSWQNDRTLGIETSVVGACAERARPNDDPPRNDSVLMTKEIRVEVHYEPDLEKNPWAAGAA